MTVQPYLFFDGRCEEALAFYKHALGAQVQVMMRFSDAPPPPADAPPPPEGCAPQQPQGDKIMHAAFTIGDALLMASDGMNGGKPEFKGISLSLAAKDDAEARRLFEALADGGQAQMPLTETFFATSFGMVADKFGVGWMVVAAKPMG